jgi:signal transduction histidine kinase
VRIDEIVWDVRESVEELDASYQVLVELKELPEDESRLCIQGNPHLLKTAIGNVVENACKFSPEKKALVRLQCTATHIELEVFDKGPGISKSDLGQVFQPFFRADATSKTKGYGIGLSLSQRIVSLHRGEMSIDSEPGRGTRVLIAFASR